LKKGAFILILAFVGLTGAEAQFIEEVIEYTPAPGQLINLAPWGTPGGARSIEGGVKGSVSLGAFGGYIIFRFEHPVENDPQNPYGVDFTIFGNPIGDWSEPGSVWVMQDENQNGEADDTWYELAGSDQWFSTTLRNRSVTYFNPGGDEVDDVPWEDNLGNSGVIRVNSVYTQPYYPMHDSFPAISPDSMTLEGTLIQGHLFENTSGINSLQRAFGYADNRPRGSSPYTLPDNPYTRVIENSGGDGFDIDWAVDSNGLYQDLDSIHFIKVQSAMQDDGGWLGELSTELTGAVDVPPDPSITGEAELVVIRDLPALLETDEYQLEVFVFHNGRIKSNAPVNWTTSKPSATVDGNHLLRVTEEGSLTITAALFERPEINATVCTTVQLTPAFEDGRQSTNDGIVLYPNPSSDRFKVKGIGSGSLTLMDISGKEMMMVDPYQEDQMVDISGYPDGIYMVRMEGDNFAAWLKLVKR
jgi:hypothetical protein